MVSVLEFKGCTVTVVFIITVTVQTVVN